MNPYELCSSEDFKSSVSTNSTTPARSFVYYRVSPAWSTGIHILKTDKDKSYANIFLQSLEKKYGYILFIPLVFLSQYRMSEKKDPAHHERIEIMPGMIDSHFHTAVMRQKGLDIESILSNCFESGFEGGIDIGTQAGDTSERYWVHEKHHKIAIASGLYPSEAEQPDMVRRLDLLVSDIETYHIAAIGEIGIDLHWNYATPEIQQELFAAQIEIANQYKVPIIVHNRKADQLFIDTVTATPPIAGGIMHCFSSDYSFAKRCIDMGFYISFAGNVTYKNSRLIREAAAKIPIEPLLLETDSPYLSPQKVRGHLNHPGHMGFIYREIADLRGMDIMELVKVVKNNLFPSMKKNGVFLSKVLFNGN